MADVVPNATIGGRRTNVLKRLVKAVTAVGMCLYEVDDRDADVGEDESHSEIPTEVDGVGETIAPIVEGEVGDLSCANVDNIADLSEQTDAPSVEDTMGKPAETSNISVNIEDVGMVVNNYGEGGVNVSSVEDTMTDGGGGPSADGLVENVTPSIRDTAIEDAEGMKSMDVPSVAGTDGLTVGKEDVTPNVVNTSADVVDMLEERAESIVGEGVADTLNTKVLEILEIAGQEKKEVKEEEAQERC
ncbi:hypothetical protein LIER_05846 [Lithospermum erythrorhizon]|uniref:Uncharacterized protein n=1 Tax=Lithospermum erythrorhizon TaxID=34254 RepID=A0AAV3P6R4_LITER